MRLRAAGKWRDAGTVCWQQHGDLRRGEGICPSCMLAPFTIQSNLEGSALDDQCYGPERYSSNFSLQLNDWTPGARV